MEPVRFNALVASLEQLAQDDPGALKRRVRWLVALGYGYVLAVLLLLLGTVGVLLALTIARGRGVLALKLIIPLGLLAYLILKALWMRSAAPEGFVITAKDAPRLARRVEEIRRALKAPRIDAILLTTELNAAAAQVPRFGVLGVPRTYLVIGLPLMYALGPRHFDSVLAHELGHHSGAHPKYSYGLFGIGQTWRRLLGQLKASNGLTDFVFERFAGWYIPRLDAHRFALSRADEYAADADAARVTSRRTAGQALASVELRGVRFHEYWERIRDRVESEPTPPTRSWTEIPQWIADGDADPARAERLMRAIGSDRLVEDFHPSLRERLSALAVLQDPLPEPEGLVADLVPAIGTPAAVYYLGPLANDRLLQCEKEFCAKNEESWKAAHDHFRERRARTAGFAALDSQAGPLSAADLWEWANAVSALDGDAAAQPLVERALAADPSNAAAHFMLGRLLLSRRDPAGVGHLQRAMEIEPQSVPDATELLRRFHAAVGDRDGLAAAEARAHEQFASLRESTAEREALRANDVLVAPELSPEDVAQLVAATRVKGVGALWVARKVTKGASPRPLLAIMVETKGWTTNLLASNRTRIAGEVFQRLKLSGDPDLIVVSGTDDLAWFVTKVKQAGGLHVTSRAGAVTARPAPWHKKHRRALVVATVGVALIAFFVWGFWVPTRTYDRAGMLSEQDRTRFDGLLGAIMAESGVDIRIVLDSLPLSTDISTFALTEARRLGMGATSDRRGLLLLVDAASGALRIEVGPGLEGIFPDGFVGGVLRAHTADLRRNDTMPRTLLSTLMILHHRIRESALAREYDPTAVTAIADSVRLAAGGGATFSGDLDQALRLDVTPDSALETLLAPGASPEETLQMYRAWLTLPVYVPRARFLTPSSRTFYRYELKMTPAFWEFLRYQYVGTPMRVETRGDLAVAFATADPLIGPLFFRRTDEGWMMDAMAELMHSQNVVGGPYAWQWQWHGDEFDHAFEDMLVQIQTLRRFRDGANEAMKWGRSNR